MERVVVPERVDSGDGEEVEDEEEEEEDVADGADAADEAWGEREEEMGRGGGGEGGGQMFGGGLGLGEKEGKKAQEKKKEKRKECALQQPFHPLPSSSPALHCCFFSLSLSPIIIICKAGTFLTIFANLANLNNLSSATLLPTGNPGMHITIIMASKLFHLRSAPV